MANKLNSFDNSKLFVRNIQQKILFEWVLQAQLSDGYWENMTPHNHFHIWNCAECIVANNEQTVGRTFYAARDNYNLVANELLEAMGDRMLMTAILAIALGDQFESTFEKLPKIHSACSILHLFNDDFSIKQRELLINDYYKEIFDTFHNSLDMPAIAAKCANVHYYNMAALKRDLTDLKKIFKTRI